MTRRVVLVGRIGEAYTPDPDYPPGYVIQIDIETGDCDGAYLFGLRGPDDGPATGALDDAFRLIHGRRGDSFTAGKVEA